MTMLPSRPSRHARPLVLAHYMPWFRAEPLVARRDEPRNGTMTWEHWDWSGPGPTHDPNHHRDDRHRDIASVYYPLIGPYDGRDPAVLEYHMLTAKAAGINGFVADWYGPRDFTDTVFAAMVASAEGYGMKVAVCLEEKTCFPPYAQIVSRAGAQDALQRLVRHVLDTHARSPAYLRRGGAAVFFVFPGHGESALGPHALSPGELDGVLRRFRPGELLYLHTRLEPAFDGIGGGRFVWNADGRSRDAFYGALRAARARGAGGYWVGGAYPGFDDTGCWGWGRGARVTERRGTREYEENWDEVLQHRPDAVQVATWNDFQEGTTIEPAEEYGFTFLDLTARYVREYTGRRLSAAGRRRPYRLYRLRRAVEALGDTAPRQVWTRRLDRLAAGLARGQQLFVDWKLDRLEDRLDIESH